MTSAETATLQCDEATEGRLPIVSDRTVAELVAEVERTGFATLPGYISPKMLAELKDFAISIVQKAGGEYTALSGKPAVAGTPLAELPEHPAFRSLVRRLYEGATARPAPEQSMHQVLRCLAGKTGMKESLIFHYDSYAVTILLPIVIPRLGRRGDLVMAPNLRTIRSSYTRNLLDKILIDNSVSQLALRWLYKSGAIRLKRVQMNPGDLYVFWGYRTLHANEPCDLDSIRSTALFHFGDPHSNSPLRRALGRVAV